MYEVSDRYKENIAKLVTFTGIHGTLALNDGTTVEFSDNNVKQGSLSISSRMNTAGEFRSGGVFSSELSLTLINFDGASSLADAIVEVEFRLYTDSTFSEYDAVPLGFYRVDSTSIKRKKDTVSLKANDDLRLFSADCDELEGTLYELVSAACTACGVTFGMTQEEFEQLPNGTITAKINTARIQTWSDLLMYVGVVTNSFARMSRSNTLVFVQLACTVSEGGLVIPVREVTGDLRKSTEFSDAAARITKIIMMRNGVRLKSKMEVTSSNAPITLEWADNPLLAEKTDDEVKDILTASLTEIYRCINRPYKSELIAGDPALDIGDYVRLTGGDIDTNRGYATGMITQQLWKYRGIHKIQCSVPASAAESGNTAAAQPKSQVEKELDELKAQVSEVGGDVYAVKTRDNAFNTTKNDNWGIAELRPYRNATGAGVTLVDSNGKMAGNIALSDGTIMINNMAAENGYAPGLMVEISKMELKISDPNTQSTPLTVGFGSNNALTFQWGGSAQFEVYQGGAAYIHAYNGKTYRVVTEEIT